MGERSRGMDSRGESLEVAGNFLSENSEYKNCLEVLLSRLEGQMVESLETPDIDYLIAAQIGVNDHNIVLECPINDCTATYEVATIDDKLVIVSSDVRTNEVPCEE